MPDGPDRLAHHFTTMAYQNAWANHRLLGAVARLSDAEFAAPRTSFFPSLRATLNHLVTVDWYYVDAFERGVRDQPVNPLARSFFEPREPFASCGPLRIAQRAVDQRGIDLCTSLRAGDLDRPIVVLRATGPVTDSLHRLLAHLFQHQIHHRGQAHAMLAGTSVAPPPLDEFFCSGDDVERQADFAELGFSEAQIWGTLA